MTKITQMKTASLLLLCALTWACQPEPTPLSYPQTNTVGYKVLKDNCSQCHAAPQPASRHAGQWPAIVYRMQQHRLKKAFDPIDKVHLQHLISYLQRNARP